jgi:hypothetical protein
MQLYTYITNITVRIVFVKYPISVTIADGTKTTVTSDELQAAISASLKTEETIALAAQNRKK